MTAATPPPPRDGEVQSPEICSLACMACRPAAPSEPPAADSPTPGTETCAPDCADRTACPVVGEPGHWQCGTCPKHKEPRHHCGCPAAPSPVDTTEPPAARWLRERVPLTSWQRDIRRYALSPAQADRLAAELLDRTQPDGDVQYATARHAFGSPEYLAELDKLSGPPDPGPQCPSTSHDTDGGWRCEHRAGHDGRHRNREEEW